MPSNYFELKKKRCVVKPVVFSGSGKKDKNSGDCHSGRFKLMRMRIGIVVLLLIGMVGGIFLSKTLPLHGSFSMIFLIINYMQLQSHQMTLSVPP